MKRKILLLTFISIFVCSFYAYLEPVKIIKRKNIEIDFTPNFVMVKKGKLITEVHHPERGMQFISAGITEDEKTYTVEETFLEKSGKYLLKIKVGKNLKKEIYSNYDAYSAVIFHFNGKYYLSYLTDDFSIVLIGLEDGFRKEIKIKKPIYGLHADEKGEKLCLNVFLKKRYIKKCINYNELLEGKNLFLKKVYLEKFDFEDIFNKKQIEPPSDMKLDYSQYICVGDSITYGYINKQPAPELGYVPRLQELFDSWIKGLTAINEGIPAAKTYTIIEVLDDILFRDNGKTILLHIGTNDIIHLDIPVETTLFNFNYIVDTMLNGERLPITSTLIPRNGWFGGGIFKKRALEVCDGIRETAEKNSLPMIDFWEIFSNYPEEDGGYFSLMSDNVHPSEKGYQLMANEWFSTIRSFPPEKPKIEEIETIYDHTRGFTGIRIKVDEPVEPDFSEFEIYYKTDTDKTFKLIDTFKTTEYKLFLAPGKTYYIYILARDIDGNASEYSEKIVYVPLRIIF